MRSEATAHRHRDPPPHNKYGKSQVQKTRNDLIDTISKVIYRSWLCLPFITHILDRFSFRSFPSSRVAVRVNLLLFVFEGPSEALGVLTNPLSEDAALFCFSHTFFVPSHPHLLPGSRQKMPATNRKASSQPIPDSISFSSLEIHHVTQTQTRPGPGQSHLPAPGPRFSAKALLGHTPGQQSRHCPHHGTFAGVTLRSHNATSTVSPTTSSPPPSRNTSDYSSPQNPMGSEREMGKKAETAPG